MSKQSKTASYEENLRRSCDRAAHRYLKVVWAYGFMTKAEACSWMSGVIGVPVSEGSIDQLSLEDCSEITRVCKAYLNEAHDKRVADNLCAGVSPIEKVRLEERMAEIDDMPADLRSLVREEGYTLIRQFLNLGVDRVASIQKLLDVVRKAGPDPLVFNSDAFIHKSDLVRSFEAAGIKKPGQIKHLVTSICEDLSSMYGNGASSAQYRKGLRETPEDTVSQIDKAA